jgi:hypothetical protein
VLPGLQFLEERQKFLDLGFTFGDPVPGDPLFQQATLPEGWSKQPTDHSMWTKIVDDRGVERVEVFYKAAYYDRSAFMRLTNVGAGFVTEYLYADVKPVWDGRYTAEEREQALASCDRYAADSWASEENKAAASECRAAILAAAT